MKEYQLSIALNGRFLARTEFMQYTEFKLAIKTLLPLIKANPDISITFNRRVIENLTTYDTHIDDQNALDILENLAQDEK